MAPCVAILLLSLIPWGVAHAEIFIEPEFGVRTFTNDVGDLLGPGVTMGGVVGIDATPRLRMFAHVEVSFHPAAGDTAYNQVNQGLAIGMTLGSRFLPMGRAATRAVQAYLEAEAGFTFFNWNLKDEYFTALGSEWAEKRDGLAALTVGGEAGVLVRASPKWTLSLAARLRHHISTDTPPNGFKSLAPKMSPGGTRHFEGGECSLERARQAYVRARQGRMQGKIALRVIEETFTPKTTN